MKIKLLTLGFFEKTINAQLPDHLNDLEIFELVKTKFMPTLELAGNTIRINATSHLVDILLRRQLLQKHLIVTFVMLKSKRINMEKYTTKASQNLY